MHSIALQTMCLMSSQLLCILHGKNLQAIVIRGAEKRDKWNLEFLNSLNKEGEHSNGFSALREEWICLLVMCAGGC